MGSVRKKTFSCFNKRLNFYCQSQTLKLRSSFNFRSSLYLWNRLKLNVPASKIKEKMKFRILLIVPFLLPAAHEIETPSQRVFRSKFPILQTENKRAELDHGWKRWTSERGSLGICILAKNSRTAVRHNERMHYHAKERRCIIYMYVRSTLMKYWYLHTWT